MKNLTIVDSLIMGTVKNKNLPIRYEKNNETIVNFKEMIESKNVLPPLRLDTSIFKKTESEKVLLKKLKSKSNKIFSTKLNDFNQLKTTFNSNEKINSLGNTSSKRAIKIN
jgi:hypothetical protein